MSQRQKIRAGRTVDWTSFPVIPLSLVATEVVKLAGKGDRCWFGGKIVGREGGTCTSCGHAL